MIYINISEKNYNCIDLSTFLKFFFLLFIFFVYSFILIPWNRDSFLKALFDTSKYESSMELTELPIMKWQSWIWTQLDFYLGQG